MFLIVRSIASLAQMLYDAMYICSESHLSLNSEKKMTWSAGWL